MLFLSLVPFILFIALLFYKRARFVISSSLAFFVTLAISIVFWKIEPFFIYASVAKGVFIAFDILLIVFGAIYFLQVLKENHIISQLCSYLGTFSKDYRVQVILLAWFLENFLEGTAGFGTPSTVAAPLLVGVGLAPILAVAVSLLGNSTSVAFGAAGTPTRIGFAGVNYQGAARLGALINIVGFIVPTFMLFAITRGRKASKKEFFEALPFAIFSGFAFTIPAYFSIFLGEEFPSIVGSLVGIILILAVIKLKILTPKSEITIRSREETKHKTSTLKIVLPYLILVALLIVGKFTLKSSGVNLPFAPKHTFLFFNPGFAFVISALLTKAIYKKNSSLKSSGLFTSFKKSIEPFLVISTMSIMVQLFINSGENSLGIESMMEIIAKNFENGLLPLTAPLVGAFGNFLTGSATVSNVMFGQFFFNAASKIETNTTLILALELVGAAAGNMVALADILPAQAVVGIKNKEKEVLKVVIIPCLIYVALTALIGFTILKFRG